MLQRGASAGLALGPPSPPFLGGSWAVDEAPLSPSSSFLFVIEHMMPLCMVISWVYSVAMMIQHIVAEKEHHLKEARLPDGRGGRRRPERDPEAGEEGGLGKSPSEQKAGLESQGLAGRCSWALPEPASSLPWRSLRISLFTYVPGRPSLPTATGVAPSLGCPAE